MIIKKFGVFFLIFLFLFEVFFFGSEESVKMIQIKVQKANIRLKPTIESPIISAAPIASVFFSYQKIGNWYEIDLPPDERGIIVTGFVHESIVNVEEADQGILNRKQNKGAVFFRIRTSKPSSEVKLKPVSDELTISKIPIGVVLSSDFNINGWYKIILPADEHGIQLSGYISEGSVEMIEENRPEKEIKTIHEEMPARIKQQEKTVESKTDKNISENKYKRQVDVLTGFSLAVPGGDMADLFNLGLGVKAAMNIPCIEKPDIDLIGTIEGILFFREAGYIDISWTRLYAGLDGRMNFRINKINPFIQAGFGFYLDLLSIDYYVFSTSGSEFEVGLRLGAGIQIGRFEILGTYHIVDRNMLLISIGYLVKHTKPQTTF